MTIVSSAKRTFAFSTPTTFLTRLPAARRWSRPRLASRSARGCAAWALCRSRASEFAKRLVQRRLDDLVERDRAWQNNTGKLRPSLSSGPAPSNGSSGSLGACPASRRTCCTSSASFSICSSCCFCSVGRRLVDCLEFGVLPRRTRRPPSANACAALATFFWMSKSSLQKITAAAPCS